MKADEPLNDEGIMFDAAMAKFELRSRDQNSFSHMRRSGHKKIDDDHLIRLKTKQMEESKNKEEMDSRKQRTKFVMEKFSQLIEDGKLTKDQMREGMA